MFIRSLYKEYRGKGYGKEALEAILMYAVSVFSIKKIFAMNPQEDASYQHLLVNLGFVMCKEENKNIFVYELIS